MVHAPVPTVHVHVPYADFKKYLPLLRKRRLGVELYMGTVEVDDVSERDLHAIKAALDWSPSLSIHGPFMDLSPGAVDPKIAAASLERYLQVMSFSAILRPKVVVFHSGYESWKYDNNVNIWLDSSLHTWRAVMDAAEKINVSVAIENIVDAAPEHLHLLAEKVGHPNFGLCLDVGHREIFSRLPIAAWVDGMHPHIKELHLHDNLGISDNHMPIGEGKVNFTSLFGRLKELSASPVLTVEAHTPDGALLSIERLKQYMQ